MVRRPSRIPHIYEAPGLFGDFSEVIADQAEQSAVFNCYSQGLAEVGLSSGVRGVKEINTEPVLCLLLEVCQPALLILV